MDGVDGTVRFCLCREQGPLGQKPPSRVVTGHLAGSSRAAGNTRFGSSVHTITSTERCQRHYFSPFLSCSHSTLPQPRNASGAQTSCWTETLTVRLQDGMRSVETAADTSGVTWEDPFPRAPRPSAGTQPSLGGACCLWLHRRDTHGPLSHHKVLPQPKFYVNIPRSQLPRER